MPRCHVCGKDVDMPYRCSYCNRVHCDEHRLPEAHMCPDVAKAAAARLQRERTGHPGVEIQGGVGQRARGPGAGGTSFWARSMGKLEGKLALGMLAAIVAVWILERIVIGTAGCPSPRPGVPWECHTFDQIFVLDAGFLLKPWTLITSIFAHDPWNLSHILFNGIILFFFGPLLERSIGSRRFLGLVLAGGMLAGLAQVGFTSYLGGTRGVIGISGALMAILGTLTVLGPRLTVLLFFVIPTPLWVITIGYAVLDILGVISPGGSIANMAHLAGLALGLLVGYQLRQQGFAFSQRRGNMQPGFQSRW